MRAGPLVAVGAASALLTAGVLAATGVPGGGPVGPASSSYAVGDDGLSRWAQQLRDAGRRVEQRRSALDVAPIDPAATVVVLDAPDLPAAEARALREHLRRGGRAVLGGERPTWLAEVLARPPVWADGLLPVAKPLVPVAETAGVTDVVAGGGGEWTAAGSSVPFLACNGRVLATVAAEGAGRVVLLADAAPLQNRLLGARQNAQLGQALVGPGPVVFAEEVHGFGEPSGLLALPGGARAGLLALAVAALAALAAATRLRALPAPVALRAPARSELLAGTAASLTRSRDLPGTAAPLQAAALEELRRRAGLRAGEPDDPLRLADAARRAGLTADDLTALQRPASTDEDLLVVGRVAARLT